MRKTSLKMRIYLLLMAMLAAATGIIVYLTCRISYENAREMSMNTSRQLVETASAEINSLFGDMWDISRILGRDTRVQRIMRTQYEKQRDMFSDTFEVSAMLSEYNQFYHLVEAQHDRTDLVVFHYLCPSRHVARTHTADHLVQFIQRAQQTADHAVCRQRRQSQY